MSQNQREEWERMRFTMRLILPVVKLFSFPSLPANPQKGKWYRIPLPECKSASGRAYHGNIRIGTENKLIIAFHGGGVSWNEFMAARPNSYITQELHPNFYASDADELADLVSNHGINNNKANNPFRGWSVVNIPYSSGDFHVGTNDYPYTSLGGNQRVLHHHGYINYRAVVREAVKYTGASPEKILVTGFSAGGFGAALLTDDVMSIFPDCKDVTCWDDSGFMLYDGWREAAEKVWKAPREIFERLHTNDLVLDSLQALNAKHRDKVRILLSCSTRDAALSAYWNYVRDGKLYADKETGIRFQKDLKFMVGKLLDTIPGAGVYLFDKLALGKGFKPDRVNELTQHCIGMSSTAYKIRVDGMTAMEWIWDAVNGKVTCAGLDLLDTFPQQSFQLRVNQ